RRTNSGRAPAAIHATWIPRRGAPADGFLFLWGPDKPSRFPWKTALDRLGLRIDDDVVLESTSVKLVLPRDNRFKIVNTHGVAIKPVDVVRLLGTARFE